MTMTQLQHYISLCETLSFTKAAEENNVSQPTISRSIRALEEAFSLNLVVRKYHEVSLTLDGQYFYEHAKKLLQDMELLEKEMLQKGREKDETIRIGALPSTAQLLLQNAVQDYARRNEKFRYILFENDTKSLLEMLKKDQLDVIVIGASNQHSWQDSDFSCQVLHRLEMCFCTNQENPLANCTSIDPVRIDREPLSVLEEGFQSTSAVRAYFEAHQVKQNIQQVAKSYHSILESIRLGRCSGILFYEVAAKTEGVVAIPFTEPIYIDLCMVVRKRSASKKLQQFITHLQNVELPDVEVAVSK